MKKKLILTGYGTVSKEFIKRILTQRNSLIEKYSIDFSIVGIVGSKGMLYQGEGINLESLLEYGSGSHALSSYSDAHQIPLLAPRIQGDVLIECTPTNIATGEPGLSYILQAIDSGMDIVSISKGALVHSFQEIKEAVKKKDCQLKFSGATAAALPALDIGNYSLSGTTIKRIEGILNGTSNFILTSMMENDWSFEEALAIAKEKGIAESNPALDVQGIDSASKILLLANSLLDITFSIEDVAIKGIEEITKSDIQAAKKKGKTFKLLASACNENGNTRVSVSPCEISDNHPLSHVKGTNKGVLFETVEMGTICTTGGASHPKGAAAAALKDIINLYRTDEMG